MITFATLLFSTTPTFAQPGPGAPMHARALTAEQEAEVLQFVSQRDPAKAARLRQVRQRDPMQFRMMATRIHRMMEMEEDDPAARERHDRMESLRHRIQALVIDIRRAEGKEKDKLTKQLRSEAETMFELKQEERRARIAMMRSRIADAETEIDAAESEKDARVDALVEKMLEGRP